MVLRPAIPREEVGRVGRRLGLEQLEDLGRAIGIGAMRHYVLREMPLGDDGDFTFESLFCHLRRAGRS